MKKIFDPCLTIKRFDREAMILTSGKPESTNKLDAENYLKTKVTDPNTIDILVL